MNRLVELLVFLCQANEQSDNGTNQPTVRLSDFRRIGSDFSQPALGQRVKLKRAILPPVKNDNHYKGPLLKGLPADFRLHDSRG